MYRKLCTVSSTFSKVHDYFVGDQIGNGYFSTIHAAFSTKVKNSFAIKILHKDQFARIPRGERIIFNESILAPLLDHPNIIHIQEDIESEHQLFQVMNFAPNKDLLNYLRHSELDPEVTIKMMDQLLSSVEYLHSLGICHRDIKLENILLTENLTPILTDFGLSSIPFENKLHNHCGSKGYVAPEAISDPQFDGYKADIWSLGVVFYIMFTRSMPFQEDNLDFESQIRALDFSRFPNEIRNMILAMWARNPSDRPAAAQCRTLSLFNQIQNRNPPPEAVVMALVNPLTEVEGDVVSRISQVMNVPIPTFMQRLNSNGTHQEKLFCILLTRKMQKLKSPVVENVFKRSYTRTSQPVRNAPLVQRHEFSISASNLLFEINRFLLPRSACITSPLSIERSIVTNTTTGDAKVTFDLTDSIENGTCVLILTTEKKSIQLSKDLLEYLRKKFPGDSDI